VSLHNTFWLHHLRLLQSLAANGREGRTSISVQDKCLEEAAIKRLEYKSQVQYEVHPKKECNEDVRSQLEPCLSELRV
jgi:hypothetical protein